MQTGYRSNVGVITLVSIALSLAGVAISFFLIRGQLLPYAGGRSVYSLKESSGTSLTFTLKGLYRAKPKDVADSALANHLLPAQTNIPHTVHLQREQLTLSQTPIFLLWIMTFCIMVGTSFAFILPAFAEIDTLRQSFRMNTLRVYAGLAVFVAMLALVVYKISLASTGKVLSAFDIINQFGIMLRGTTTVKTFVVIAIIIGCLSVYGMLVVLFAMPSLTKPLLIRKEHNQSLILRFTQLQDSLRFFLTISSVLVLFSVITTSFIQQSIDASISLSGYTLFPSEFTYAYGLVFTIFLAAIYLPIHFQLRRKGRQLFNDLSAGNPDGDNTLSVLNVKESGLKNLQVVLSILSPFLGSVFSESITSLM